MDTSVGEYNNDIVRIFTAAFENEKQELNSQGVKEGWTRLIKYSTFEVSYDCF